MAAKVGSIVIDILANTQRLVKDMNKAKKAVQGTVKGIKSAIAGLAIGAAFTSALKTGYKYNKLIEEQTAGLTALIAATSKQEDALGNAISVTELYTRANAEAIVTLKKLEQINKETPHTLGQTSQIYKAMLPGMKAVGLTTDEIVQVTKQLSIASGAAGIQFQQLLAGADGLAAGMVMSNSELGRFLNTLGLGNDVLRNSTDLVGLFEEKLGTFTAPDTMAVAISNLDNAWQKFMGALTSDGFSIAKDAVKGLTKQINLISDSLGPANSVILAFASQVSDAFNLAAVTIKASFLSISYY